MCSNRGNQHLIILNLYSVSINEILATEFITVKSFRVKYVTTVKSTT